MKISKNVIWREFEGSIFIIIPEKEMLYELNETASFIFKLLLKDKNKSEMKKIILNEYDSLENEVEKDIDDVISYLTKEGILYEK